MLCFQMSDVLESLPFDNAKGGVWNQGFELSYSMNSFSAQDPLQVFIMPHSHNDPGDLADLPNIIMTQVI